MSIFGLDGSSPHGGVVGPSVLGLLLLCGCEVGDPNPVVPDRLVLSTDAVHTLAKLDVVARVVDLQPTPDGRVLVLNSVSPFFVLLAPDGQVERQFGEEGGGPDEFGAPVALVRGPDQSEVWTYDVPRNALIRIVPEERREMALPRDSISPLTLISFQGAGIRPAPPWLAATDEGFLVGRSRAWDEGFLLDSNGNVASALPLWNADILLLRDRGPGVEVELHTPVADLLGDPGTLYPGATASLPYPLWTACTDGTVGLYDPRTNTLRRLTRDGGQLPSFALPDERRVELTADRLFAMFYRQLQEDTPTQQLPEQAGLRAQLQGPLDRLVGQSAPVFPEYADLRCAPDGTLWLQLFDIESGRLGHGPEWLRISTDGSRTTLVLPAEFSAFRFGDGRIWGAALDPLGVASVSWIDLPGTDP